MGDKIRALSGEAAPDAAANAKDEVESTDTDSDTSATTSARSSADSLLSKDMKDEVSVDDTQSPEDEVLSSEGDDLHSESSKERDSQETAGTSTTRTSIDSVLAEAMEGGSADAAVTDAGSTDENTMSIIKRHRDAHNEAYAKARYRKNSRKTSQPQRSRVSGEEGKRGKKSPGCESKLQTG